jgi:hypothetical protein
MEAPLKYYPILLLAFLAACAPSPAAIQAAIYQTQNAAATATGAVMGEAQRIQTGVVGTISAWGTSTAVEYESEKRIKTAVVLTQGSLVSLTQIPPTPLPSNTSLPPTATRRPTFTPAPPAITIIPSGPITITQMENLGDNRVLLTWEAEGSFLDGFVVVWSQSNSEPAYPDDYWARFGNGSIRSIEIQVAAPNNYFFRVCEYNSSGKCANYSNVYSCNVE